VRSQPDAGALSALGLVDAYLGRKVEAVREARQAVAFLPVAEKRLEGADALYCLAVVSAVTGERGACF
jgi:Flp pilus assembly protein TadD